MGGWDQVNQNKSDYGNMLFCKLIKNVIQKEFE